MDSRPKVTSSKNIFKQLQERYQTLWCVLCSNIRQGKLGKKNPKQNMMSPSSGEHM